MRMVKKHTVQLVSLILFVTAASLQAGPPSEQVRTLFNQANQDFRQANSAEDTEQAAKLYEKAILGYEKVIEQGQIKNAKLYYNLANAYLLKGEVGKAILNYRRAERLDNSDENMKKNLAFARSRRIDKVAVKTETRVLQTLFFWHYDFSIQTKFLLTCIFFGIVCICIAGMIWLGRNGLLMTVVVISGILTICFFSSVIVESSSRSREVCGVVTAKEIIARQGDGQNYPPSFKEPLHEGTEFDLLEARPGWLHIKLSDGSDGWISDGCAHLI
jgi:hypothetical protein